MPAVFAHEGLDALVPHAGVACVDAQLAQAALVELGLLGFAADAAAELDHRARAGNVATDRQDRGGDGGEGGCENECTDHDVTGMAVSTILAQ